MNQKSLRRCSKLRCEALSARSVAIGEPYLSHLMTWPIYFSSTRRLNLVKRFGFFFKKKEEQGGLLTRWLCQHVNAIKMLIQFSEAELRHFRFFSPADGSTTTLRRSFRVRTVTLAFASSTGIDPHCGWLLDATTLPPSQAAGLCFCFDAGEADGSGIDTDR